MRSAVVYNHSPVRAVKPCKKPVMICECANCYTLIQAAYGLTNANVAVNLYGLELI